MKTKLLHIIIVSSLICLPNPLSAQGQLSDYQRAESIRELYRNKTNYDRVNTNWIDSTNILWYTVNTPKGTEYFLVDAEKGTKKTAFDQERFAKALGVELDKEEKAYELSIRNIEFARDFRSMEFTSGRAKYKCDFKKYKIEKLEDIPERNRNEE